MLVITLQELVTAKYNYRREVPSMEAYRTPTSMSGGGVPGQAPPDLPSLLLNSRIVYLGMPLVPAVTELLVAELLYMGFDNPEKPVYLYINSSGSQTQNGEAVGFETEAYAIMDTMRCVRCAASHGSLLLSRCPRAPWQYPVMQLVATPVDARNATGHNTPSLAVALSLGRCLSSPTGRSVALTCAVWGDDGGVCEAGQVCQAGDAHGVRGQGMGQRRHAAGVR